MNIRFLHFELQSVQNNRRRLNSSSLMKLFMDHRDNITPMSELSHEPSYESRFGFPLHHQPTSSHNSLQSSHSSPSSAISTEPRASYRRPNRGSSLDRSSIRVPHTQPSAQMEPMSSSYYLSTRDESPFSTVHQIPRYIRTISDRTMDSVNTGDPNAGTQGQPGMTNSATKLAPRVHIRTQQGRPPVVHMELSFNGRQPNSIGLTHSWSNHGLWQQQHPANNPGTPTRIEMRVHYAGSSSFPSTPSASGMPPRPPKPTATLASAVEAGRHEKQHGIQESIRVDHGMEPPEEESVSDRINR
ncbi:hypothetical protein BIW11_04899, partial [Tropilaelaps mercedesae]